MKAEILLKPSDVNWLLTLIRWNENEGVYCGNNERWTETRERVKHALSTAFEEATNGD